MKPQSSISVDEAVTMALACRNVDHGPWGYYALLVDKPSGDRGFVGRGDTVWDAVYAAYALRYMAFGR